MIAAINRAALPCLVAGVLLVAAAGLSFLAVSKIGAMINEAAASARAERDAHWAAEIERANAHAARSIADQAREALRVETAANDRIRAAEQEQLELEKNNAALPDGGACGLDHGRVRLLAR
ncbi:hypothetical protein [Ensifer aridi]|uniref:hypothetical protein n=1 Tax=Ensifer aridi TaxID=1708715 RepID=UPI000A119578|nr:hypothetical protein [Ensifer aridi]